jgi:hypothetical protein
MAITNPFQSKAVADTVAGYPPAARRKLMQLRALILATAVTAEVGEIEETLKWGEPAYLTPSKSGSTLRIAWKPAKPDQVGVYFNFQTDLGESFRRQFPHDFAFEGNRAITFNIADEIQSDKLAICIAAALTYHRRKKTA